MIEFDKNIDYAAIVKSWIFKRNDNVKLKWCPRCHGTGDLYDKNPKPYDIILPCISCKTQLVHAPTWLKIWSIEPTDINVMARYWSVKHIIDANYKRAIYVRKMAGMDPLPEYYGLDFKKTEDYISNYYSNDRNEYK